MATMAEALATIAGVTFSEMTAPHAEKVAKFLERVTHELVDREAACTLRERAVNDREAAVQLRENNAESRIAALDSVGRLHATLQTNPKGRAWYRRG